MDGLFRAGVEHPNYKHGLRGTAIYNIWVNMRRRCHDPSSHAYVDYGARGIAVCDRWMNDVAAFSADMGPRPSPKHMVERVNNDLGYSPENCIWATQKEQANNRRTTRLITYKGKTQCLLDWSKEIGVDHKTLERRIAKGWSLEVALSPSKFLKRRELSLRGRTQSISEWCRELGMKEATLWGRVLKGWSDEEALTIPVGERRR